MTAQRMKAQAHAVFVWNKYPLLISLALPTDVTDISQCGITKTLPRSKNGVKA